MSFVDRLRSEIFPRAVTEGKFGEDKVKFLDYQPNEKFTAVNHHCSAVNFGDVILETEQAEIYVQSVFIKIRAGGSDPERGNVTASCLSLVNEFLFYTEILPLFLKCDDVNGTICKMFPKFFFGFQVSAGDDPTKEFLVFENVQKRGFELCPSKAFLDRDHLDLTLRKIAQFHAVSIVCKKRYPEEFKDLASKIRDLHFTEERLSKGGGGGFFKENSKRGVLPLRDDPNLQDKLTDVLKVIDEADQSMAKIVAPEESIAVICHGDLQRLNIFYRYDARSGTPCDLIFSDLATTRYCSPIIDLSLFLFTNVSPEARAIRWRDLLRTYHSTLTSHPDLDPQIIPSFADLTQDFRRRGFYGYVWSSVLLPVAFQEKQVPEEEKEWWNLSDADHVRLLLETGGEKGTYHLMQNAKFMIDEHFDFKYILSPQSTL